MKFIGLLGSAWEPSSNRYLLEHIAKTHADVFEFEIVTTQDLPMFNASQDQTNTPKIASLHQKIQQSDGVIIATPEYMHTIPAALKNALEWMSFKVHPFAKKPVLIVGSSYYDQGTSRAQLHLRQILDSPGLDAMVMPGHEFLLGNAQTVFNERGELTNEKTATFLRDTIDKFIQFVHLVSRFNEPRYTPHLSANPRFCADIVSVFPEYFNCLDLGLLGKAQSDGLLTIRTHNLRNWTTDVHHAVDDTPVGGGAGMVMKPEVWGRCLDDLLGKSTSSDDGSEDNASSNRNQNGEQNGKQSDKQTDNQIAKPTIIFANPAGKQFTQQDAVELAGHEHLIFGCGRYEGYDARIPQYYSNQGYDVREYSIGDYVLNGGEAAICVMLEAITRLIPEFMGNPESIAQESYGGALGLLEHPQYTKPTSWRNLDVPEVLTGGHHAKVERYRLDESLKRTSVLRPDLIAKLTISSLTCQDVHTLEQLGWDTSGEHPVRKTDDTSSSHEHN